jgi:hypothetical protein
MTAHFQALLDIQKRYPKGCAGVNLDDPNNPCSQADLTKFYLKQGNDEMTARYTAMNQWSKPHPCSILVSSAPTPAPNGCPKARQEYWLKVRQPSISQFKLDILTDQGVQAVVAFAGGSKSDYCAPLPTPKPTSYPTASPTQPTRSPTQPPSVIAARKAKEAKLAKQMKKASKQASAESSEGNFQLLLLAALSSVLMAYSCIGLRTLVKTGAQYFSSSDKADDFSHSEEMRLNSSIPMEKGNSRYQTSGYTPAQVAEPEEEEEEEEEEENQYAWQRSTKPNTEAKSSYYGSAPASTNDYSAEYDDNDDEYGEYNADVI